MKNFKKIISKIKRIVRKKLKNESCHDYWHCYRVVKNCLYIGKKEKANLEILELAGWLHDIAYPQDKKDHDLKGSELAKKLLPKLGVEKQIIEQVANCIKRHRFIKSKKATNLEEKILQDADKLDTLGAVGIARIFALAGEAGQLIHNPRIKPDLDYYLEHNRSNTTINHFTDKIFKLKNLMHTQTAKKIANDREKYMRAYLDRFYTEWEGKR